MNLFGLTIQRTKALPQLSTPESRGGWFPLIRESFLGSWQQNVEVNLVDIIAHPTVFACITLIASDVAKMCLGLVERDGDGIWVDTESPAFSPVLRKPNRYQTQFKFIEQWVTSKLIHGNTYALIQRDQRGLAIALYILDPQRVTPLVAPDGSVYYELKRDDLSNQPTDSVTVPASEIIHDVMYAFYHPLVGLSPLYASGLAATLGLKIITNSANFFANGSNPGGVLTAPGAIPEATAIRLKAYWEQNYSGANVGRVAVLGDGLKYEPMAVTADKSQLTEQWKGTSEAVATTFHVPWHLVGGPVPPYGNVQALTVQYFTQCIQALTVSLEQVLDYGLSLPKPYGTQFDVDDLLWMDSATMMDVLSKGTSSGLVAPNEGRKRLNMKPVEGGDTPYLQIQNYSLAALNKRDTAEPPPPTKPPVLPPTEDDEETDLEAEKFTADLLTKVALIDYAAA